MHRRLAGRVGAADDVDVLVFAGGGFGDGRAVVNARAGEPVHAWDIETPPLDPGRDHDAVSRKFLPVRQFDHAILAFHQQTHGIGGREHLGSKAAHLGDTSACEVGAAEPGGKAEIVFDARTEAGLAARSFALHENRLKPFGAAVESASKSGWSRSDDDDVVEAAAGNLTQGRAFRPPAQDLGCSRTEPSGKITTGIAAVFSPRAALHPGIGNAIGFDPAIGNLALGQEILQPVCLGSPPRADDVGSVERLAISSLPVFELISQNRVEVLLRRLPRLHQVVIEFDFVDRIDGRGRVRIGGQQHAARFRLQRDRLLQKLGAAHMRHSLIDEKEATRSPRARQLTDDADGLLAANRRRGSDSSTRTSS